MGALYLYAGLVVACSGAVMVIASVNDWWFGHIRPKVAIPLFLLGLSHLTAAFLLWVRKW